MLDGVGGMWFRFADPQGAMRQQGGFVHQQRFHLRQVASTFRKSILFSSTAMVEGWAHYAEHMMVEAGFRRQDPAVRLGQLAESLIRLCRLVVGLRLHGEDLSVEQGVRMFREEAYLEEASARREAERGTFDPTYLVYTVGKLWHYGSSPEQRQRELTELGTAGKLVRPDLHAILDDIASAEHDGFSSYWLAQTGLAELPPKLYGRLASLALA